MAPKNFNADGTPSHETAAYLAGVFADVVHEWTTPEQWETIHENNARYATEGLTSVCASHDVIDANMAMDEAFRRAFGAGPLDADIDHMDEGDRLLWNAAWALATPGWLTKGCSNETA